MANILANRKISSPDDAGADVSYYIPHRVKEGYGLHTKHITDYAIPNRINLRDNFDQMAFRLRWNHWNGKKTAQIVIEDFAGTRD